MAPGIAVIGVRQRDDRLVLGGMCRDGDQACSRQGGEACGEAFVTGFHGGSSCDFDNASPCRRMRALFFLLGLWMSYSQHECKLSHHTSLLLFSDGTAGRPGPARWACQKASERSTTCLSTGKGGGSPRRTGSLHPGRCSLRRNSGPLDRSGAARTRAVMIAA